MAGSWLARVIAMVCRARLSWRSPPRSSRSWLRWPEDAGIGATPAWRAKLASVRTAPRRRSADQGHRGQRPAAHLGEQLGALSGDQDQQISLQRLHLAGEGADLSDLFARDPDARTGWDSSQPPVDLLEHSRLLERAAFEGALELGAERDQVPAQPVLRAGALGDEILAVIREKSDLHRPLIQVGGREAIDAVLDDCPGDRESVDLIGLPGLALTSPGGAHHPRRDPHDPLPSSDQRLLKPT